MSACVWMKPSIQRVHSYHYAFDSIQGKELRYMEMNLFPELTTESDDWKQADRVEWNEAGELIFAELTEYALYDNRVMFSLMYWLDPQTGRYYLKVMHEENDWLAGNNTAIYFEYDGQYPIEVSGSVQMNHVSPDVSYSRELEVNQEILEHYLDLIHQDSAYFQQRPRATLPKLSNSLNLIASSYEIRSYMDSLVVESSIDSAKGYGGYEGWMVSNDHYEFTLDIVTQSPYVLERYIGASLKKLRRQERRAAYKSIPSFVWKDWDKGKCPFNSKCERRSFFDGFEVIDVFFH